jgi:IS1 family transposase
MTPIFPPDFQGQSPSNLASEYSRSQDGVILRCSSRDCTSTLSVRKNSIFEHRHLSLAQLMVIIVRFTQDWKVRETSMEVDIREETVRLFYDDLREIYSSWLEVDPVEFSPGSTYEIDEFSLRLVKEDGRTYYRQWVWDVVERETGRYWFFFVSSRSARVLFPCVRTCVPPNSIVFSDDWPAYLRLVEEGYEHHTVNHSHHMYSRLATIRGRRMNVHINTLEGIHHIVRARIANKSRRSWPRMNLLLREYAYRRSGKCLFIPFKTF